MTRVEILDRVTKIFRDVLDDDSLELAMETTAADVPEWDSLANLRILIAVEGDFNVRFETRELTSISNVGSLIGLIDEKRASQAVV